MKAKDLINLKEGDYLNGGYFEIQVTNGIYIISLLNEKGFIEVTSRQHDILGVLIYLGM